MIRILVDRNQDKQVVSLKVTGHAAAGPHGQDIVCAGVSALTQTALLGLLNHLQIPVIYDLSAGKLAFELQNSPDEKTQAVLETMLLGLQEMARNYPRNIQIREQRR